MNISLITQFPEFENEYVDVVNAFSPYVKLDENGLKIQILRENLDDSCKISIKYGDFHNTQTLKLTNDLIVDKRYLKRISKTLLYQALTNLTNVSLPWGSLTGIRPTKLARELGGAKFLQEDFFVSLDKAKLVDDILANQGNIVDDNPKNVDIYVNIPFCVSRCSYCSFISAIYDQKKKLMKDYTKALAKEIEATIQIISNKSLNLRSIYVGGGTPTSLSADEMYDALYPLTKVNNVEFTIEAGRPDTINVEKLEVIKSVGASRISVNPQTFNKKTLDLIGRRHSVEDIYTAYDIVKRYDLSINMDLIASLPGETYQDFVNSLTCAIDLCPDDITVHTLAIKRSSSMSLDGYDNTSDVASMMVEYSLNTLQNAGYKPYYLYRQKHMSGNLENVGYTRSKPVIYNIDNMEECSSILANGAGGISKNCLFGKNRIERISNAKNIEEYLRRIDEIIEKKIDFFS